MALKVITKKAAAGGTFEFKQGFNDSRMLHLCSLDTSNIRVLKLRMMEFTPKGMVDFPKANWSNLTIIDLQYSRMQTKGIKYLTQASISRLRVLKIGYNMLGNEGANHLAKGQWKFIKEIDIANSRITNGAIKELNKGNWKNLQSLDIRTYQLKNKYLMMSAILTEFKAITEIKIQDNIGGAILDHRIRKMFAKKFGRLQVAKIYQ